MIELEEIVRKKKQVLTDEEVRDCAFIEAQSRDSSTANEYFVPCEEVAKLFHGDIKQITRAYKLIEPYEQSDISGYIVKEVFGPELMGKISDALIRRQKEISHTTWLREKTPSPQEMRELRQIGCYVR